MTRASAAGGYTPERRKIDSLAREYGEAGYEVVIEPRKNALPEFLREFKPDLLAKKPGDNIVIEVTAGDEGRGHKRIAELSQVVSQHSDWRFQLVRLGSRTLRTYKMKAKGPLSWKEIGDVAEVARNLLEQGSHRAALLVAWPAFEAAARRALARIDESPPETGLGGVSALLYSDGLINRRQYDKLQRIIDVRNATAHGYASRKPNKSELAFMMELIGNLYEFDAEGNSATDSQRRKLAP